MSIILALLAALGYGVSDFSGGLSSRSGHAPSVLLYSYPVAAVVTVGMLPFAPGTLSFRVVCLATLAGLAGLLGFGLMYRLMATAPLSLISPITGVPAAATPIAFGLLAGEKPHTTGWFGIGIGLVAVALVGTAPDGSPRAQLRVRVLVMAAASGAGFGLYFVLLAHAGAGSGLWPLVIARVSALIVIGSVTARTRVAATFDRRTALLAALAGALDAGADVCFLLATRAGYLSLVSVITSLYPAVTVLLSLFLLRERAGWLPRAGLGLSVVLLALIAG